MSEWLPLDQTIFDESIEMMNVDTRDFHCLVSENCWEVDMDKVSKYPDFFFTMQEVEATVKDLYQRSGGEGTWRMLSFVGVPDQGWDFKYLRIAKTKLGYVIGTNRGDHMQCRRKSIFQLEIQKEYLAHTKKL